MLGVSGAFSSGSQPPSAIDADVAPASDATVVSHAEQTVDGETWSIHTYENVAGQLCKAEIASGIWPHRLVARDITGGVVESADASLDPPSTDQALVAGTAAPAAIGC